MMQLICGVSRSMDGLVSSVDYSSEQFTRLMEGVFYALIHIWVGNSMDEDLLFSRIFFFNSSMH